MKFKLFWALWCVAFIVGEGSALANHVKGDTLSEETRGVFHTNTRVGRAVWVGIFGVFAAWFTAHIATPAGWLFG